MRDLVDQSQTPENPEPPQRFSWLRALGIVLLLITGLLLWLLLDEVGVQVWVLIVGIAVPFYGGVPALVVYLLIVAGLAMWLHFGAIEWTYGVQFWGLMLAIALGAATPLAQRYAAGSGVARKTQWAAARAVTLLERLGAILAPRRTLVAALLGLAAGAFIFGLNLADDPDYYPSVCDEFSYLVQAQLLAHGRLWSEAHPHPDFFTTFQLIGAPVYGSIYFPGTALWLAPWSMLDSRGGQAWLGTLLASMLAIALLYLITAELLDDLAGVLVVVLTLTVSAWRGMSMLLMGQIIAAMLGLLAIYLFLRWRRAAGAGRTTSTLLLAAGAGFVVMWAILTRPVDGLAYSLPVILAVLLTRRVHMRLKAVSLVAAIAGMLPLAALQLSFNQAVSGSPLSTPFSWYNSMYLPGTNYGESDRDMTAVPPHATPHFRLSYETFTRAFVERAELLSTTERAYDRMQILAFGAVSHGLMLAWVPMGLLVLVGRKQGRFLDWPHWDRWLLALPFWLMWLLYLPYGFFLNQYATAAIPSLSFLVVAGAWGLRAVAADPGPARPAPDSPRRGWHDGLLLFSIVGLLALSTRGLPFFALVASEDWFTYEELRWVDADLKRARGPAVVFITPPLDYAPEEAEPVYNLGYAHPDAAHVVRAHDLGRRNIELLGHYAQVAPERRVYHYLRGQRVLTDLGTAAELADRPPAELEALFDELSEEWRSRYAVLLFEHGYDEEMLPFDVPQRLRQENDE